MRSLPFRGSLPRIFALLSAALLILSLAGCAAGHGTGAAPAETASTEGETTTASTAGQESDGREPETQQQEEQKEDAAMHMTVNGTDVQVLWEHNESVEALKMLLREGPLTVETSPYGGFEQVGPLGRSLPRSDRQTTTEPGDIVLYSGNQIVVFYGSNTWAYTRLGRIQGLSREELAALLGGDTVTLMLRLD